MTTDEAGRKLHDKTFLLGRFRRRAAIRELSASPDPASAIVLAGALAQGHPDATQIDTALRRLSTASDERRIIALWEYWARSPTTPLASILAQLGWPSAHAAQATWRSILATADRDVAPEILNAVTAFTQSLPLDDDEINDALCVAWVRSHSTALGQLVAGQKRQPGTPPAVIALAEAMDGDHPDAALIETVLRRLSADREPALVAALWGHWAQAPTAPLAAVLAQLGWPSGQPGQARMARDILAAARHEASPEIVEAVRVFARSLPVADEVINDAVYGAWLRTRSAGLEQLIAEQGRQPGNPALEALHALVTGSAERYAALHDDSGHLLIQAYAMASEPLRERLARAVAASPDRRLKAAYREALAGSGADADSHVDNLVRVADEDGLFESCRSLKLVQVLGLCERWAGIAARPSGASQRAAVQRAVAAYRRLLNIEPEDKPALPDGMVDILEWWRAQQPDDARLRADLDADDPFVRARGLYLGHGHGLADEARLAAAVASEHWPERLVARLVDPVLCAQPGGDHVLWASACAADAALLDAQVGGTPEEYAHHVALLAAGEADARSLGLLEILCAFQEIFVGAGITVDAGGEAVDCNAIEVEDAPDMVF